MEEEGTKENSFFEFSLNKQMIHLIKSFSGMKDDLKSFYPSFVSLLPDKKILIEKEKASIYFYTHSLLQNLTNIIDMMDSTGKSDTLIKEINKIVERGYYSLCDGTSNRFFLKEDQLDTLSDLVVKNKEIEDSNLKIRLSTTGIETSDKKCIYLNYKLMLYGAKSDGRLDIYTKAHVLKNLLIYLDVQNSLLNTLATMENDLLKIIALAENSKLTESKYLSYVDIFINQKNKVPSTIKELKKLLVAFQNVNEKESIKILEKIFIGLLGHLDREIRNDAVILLNMLYDNTNWQEKNPLPIKIKSVGQVNKIEVIIRKKDFSSQNDVVLLTSSPSVLDSNYEIMWKEVTDVAELDNPNLIKLIFNQGFFNKCGYYDWNLVKFKDGRFSTIKQVIDPKLEGEISEARGRFILLDKSIKNLSVHEVFCDLLNAEIDKEKGKITKRGNFGDFESKLEEFNQRYINCLYLMGALERDNHIIYDENSGEMIDIVDSDSSPMAVTCRATVSKLLGGDKQFKSLINRANKFSMKILVDSLTRISSSRHHRKYRNILLHTLDDKGKTTICYGTDGHSVYYEDSAILNYRKVEAWDILVEDIITFTKKYGVHGVHLDNCQSWPQMMQIDQDEMFRIDPDGKPTYSALDILNGEIVVRDEDCGFWGSDVIDQYPNPFLIKMTKEVWKTFPNFIFVGECWSSQKFHNRHIVLAKSGIVPRMYTLPRALGSVFGRRIHRNGYIESCKPTPVSIFKDWLSENYQLLPDGAKVIQSSCGQVWPYPALLYGRGNWSAVDLMFSLPDVPMTFMEEINGEAYRVQITNVYESKELPKTSRTSNNYKSKSFMNLEDGDDSKDVSEAINNLLLNTDSNSNSSFSYSRSTTSLKQTSKFTPKIKSHISLSGVAMKDIKNIKSKQESVVKEVGPEFGFDLTKIRHHYDHRRKMRTLHESLRHGSLVYLNCYDDNNDPHYNVFAFARHIPEETSIVAINFHSQSCSFKLDLKSLFPLFEYEINFNSICYIEDWITEEKGDFYFLREVISEGHSRTLNVLLY